MMVLAGLKQFGDLDWEVQWCRGVRCRVTRGQRKGLQLRVGVS